MKDVIIVIEDHVDVRKNIVEILESDNYTVLSASNGRQGVKLIEDKRPSLVLCDIMMPEMDGFEVLKKVRASHVISATPFIFLTAKTAREDMSAGMQLGADDYIMKPFTIDELLSRVHSRLVRRKEILKKSNQKLQSLTDQIGLPIVSELKEPLRTVIGLGDMIISEHHSLNKTEIVEFVTLIHKSGLELKEIVSKTMTYYDLEKICNEPQVLNQLKDSSIQVKPIVDQIAHEEARVFGRTEDLVVAVSDATAKAPYDYFVQMLREVLNNAFKFSPKGTTVSVLGASDSGNLNISVVDEGIGLSDQQLDKIGAFQTFHSLSTHGIGLGLQNAKRIAQIFDGSFDIKSKKGRGTTIKIEMPSLS